MADALPTHGPRHTQLLELLRAFGKIGETDSGGIARLAANEADGQVRDYLCKWLKDQNFNVLIDQVGNMFGVLDLGDAFEDRYFFCGSHLDSQPEAGKFDGALGVACACIAGLHLSELVMARKLDPTFRYFVVCNWTGEEGARYQPSLTGSSVYSGRSSPENTLAIKDMDGISLEEALVAIGYRGDHQIPRADQYLELHIEQGVALEEAEAPIGFVTHCWGAKKVRLEVSGVSAHTGPTPMEDRRNALLAASHVIVEVEQLAKQSAAILYSSVGRMEIHPNSPNTIADHVELWIEFRSPDEATLAGAEQSLVRVLRQIEITTGCSSNITSCETRNVVEFDKIAISEIESRFAEACIPHLHLTTVAGHDAIRMQEVCPSTLLFVPSKDGITHSVAEYTSDEDVCAGYAAMFEALSKLMTIPSSEQNFGRPSQ